MAEDWSSRARRYIYTYIYAHTSTNACRGAGGEEQHIDEKLLQGITTTDTHNNRGASPALSHTQRHLPHPYVCTCTYRRTHTHMRGIAPIFLPRQVTVCEPVCKVHLYMCVTCSWSGLHRAKSRLLYSLPRCIVCVCVRACVRPLLHNLFSLSPPRKSERLFLSASSLF